MILESTFGFNQIIHNRAGSNGYTEYDIFGVPKRPSRLWHESSCFMRIISKYIRIKHFPNGRKAKKERRTTMVFDAYGGIFVVNA